MAPFPGQLRREHGSPKKPIIGAGSCARKRSRVPNQSARLAGGWSSLHKHRKVVCPVASNSLHGNILSPPLTFPSLNLILILQTGVSIKTTATTQRF